MSRPPKVPGISPTSSPPDTQPSISTVSRDFTFTEDSYKTPPCSPGHSNPQTPVIVINPSFLPPPPLLPRYSPCVPVPLLPPRPSCPRLPEPSGRWDNLILSPTYQRPDREFWSTRQFPIPITSTVSSSILSELGFSPLSSVSTEAFEDETVIRQPDTEQLVGSDSMEEVLSEPEQSSSSMPDPVDPWPALTQSLHT